MVAIMSAGRGWVRSSWSLVAACGEEEEDGVRWWLEEKEVYELF